MAAPHLDVDAWTVREPEVDGDEERLAVSETIFALANGFLGVRGTLDEGRPCAERGTFLAGVYEHYPLSYPESGHGDPEEGQAVVSVADGSVAGQGYHTYADPVAGSAFHEDFWPTG